METQINIIQIWEWQIIKQNMILNQTPVVELRRNRFMCGWFREEGRPTER